MTNTGRPVRRLLRLAHLSFTALPVLPALPVMAQDPVRAYPMGDPARGREAPAFVLPFATAEGPAGEGQRFSLQAELGRVVVLAFCPRPSDSAAVALLRGLQSEAENLAAGNVVLAALLPEPVDRLSGRAADLGLSFKLVSDSSDGIRRAFGVGRREIGVYVIGPTGRVEWRDVRFNPFLATSYGPLWRAVQLARGR